MYCDEEVSPVVRRYDGRKNVHLVAQLLEHRSCAARDLQIAFLLRGASPGRAVAAQAGELRAVPRQLASGPLAARFARVPRVAANPRAWESALDTGSDFGSSFGSESVEG